MKGYLLVAMRWYVEIYALMTRTGLTDLAGH
jgi:hypothetical protein